jgi:glycosyltransferase involved in cell wall biosynthesis
MLMKKEVYYWAPCLDKVGTVKSTLNSAISLSKYSNRFNVSIINVFGEWDEYADILIQNRIRKINIFINIYSLLPKKGYFASRLSYIIISLISFIPLIFIIKKNKPDFLLIHLLTSIPIFLFKIFKFKTRLILRISGFPKLNFFRNYLWKSSDDIFFRITCPTEELLNDLTHKKIFSKNNIYYLPDAILNIKEYINKSKNVNLKTDLKLDKFFLSIGRFTKQKNFKYLINEFKKFCLVNSEINLLIIGDGEEKKNIQELIHKNNLEKRVKILNRTNNVYYYMKKATAFILPSLWEEVGFVIVESALCNLFIISSDCPNGPKEFLQSGRGGVLFKNNEKDSLYKSMIFFLNNKKSQYSQLVITKKNSLKYTMFRHYLRLVKILIS